MNDADAVRKLDQAVALALQLGVPCSGWVLQRAPDHVAAWLYYEDDRTLDHLSLMNPVEVFKTLEDAAEWCLLATGELKSIPVPTFSTSFQFEES